MLKFILIDRERMKEIDLINSTISFIFYLYICLMHIDDCILSV